MPLPPSIGISDVYREILVKFRSSCSHHWLCEDLGKKERVFVAPLGPHEWDIVEHPSRNVARCDVIADGTCGPVYNEFLLVFFI